MEPDEALVLCDRYIDEPGERERLLIQLSSGLNWVDFQEHPDQRWEPVAFHVLQTVISVSQNKNDAVDTMSREEPFVNVVRKAAYLIRDEVLAAKALAILDMLDDGTTRYWTMRHMKLVISGNYIDKASADE